MTQQRLAERILRMYAEIGRDGRATFKVDYIAAICRCSNSWVSKVANDAGMRRRTNGQPIHTNSKWAA